MIFTSIIFGIFFCIVALLFYLVPGKYQWLWLLASGVFFYMFSQPVYIIVIGVLIMVTFLAGKQMAATKRPGSVMKWYLMAVILNIGMLVFFKYINFFTTTSYSLINLVRKYIFDLAPTDTNSLFLTVVAPLGISYISFQAIGYLIEIRRGNHPAEHHAGHFAAYLLFFPKLVAGPVERAHHFLPQLKTKKEFCYENISAGVKLIIWGMFKKLVIADRLTIYVNAVFGNATHHSGITLLLASIFYVVQVYADFSGYTDMALGFARVLGYRLTPNFHRPLWARSVTDFWRRWHITLSTWFADYVYNPLAIAKRDWGNRGVVYSFLVSFMLLGFWHGPNWTFIVFGLLQGLILAVEFFTRKQRKKLRKKINERVNNVLGIIFTFCFFAFSLIFFQAASVGNALLIIKRIFTEPGPVFIDNPSMALFSVLGAGFLFLVEFKNEYYNNAFKIAQHTNSLVRMTYYALLLVAILLAGVFDGGQFIYFKF